MTGLLAGPLKDAAGLDAVRADLARVAQQFRDPPAFRCASARRPGLAEPGRRWRERSQADRGFDRQPTSGCPAAAEVPAPRLPVSRRGAERYRPCRDRQIRAEIPLPFGLIEPIFSRTLLRTSRPGFPYGQGVVQYKAFPGTNVCTSLAGVTKSALTVKTAPCL
jgi:hypothetical protein